jgi:hypothetical protein
MSCSSIGKSKMMMIRSISIISKSSIGKDSNSKGQRKSSMNMVGSISIIKSSKDISNGSKSISKRSCIISSIGKSKMMIRSIISKSSMGKVSSINIMIRNIMIRVVVRVIGQLYN